MITALWMQTQSLFRSRQYDSPLQRRIESSFDVGCRGDYLDIRPDSRPSNSVPSGKYIRFVLTRKNIPFLKSYM